MVNPLLSMDLMQLVLAAQSMYYGFLKGGNEDLIFWVSLNIGPALYVSICSISHQKFCQLVQENFIASLKIYTCLYLEMVNSLEVV